MNADLIAVWMGAASAALYLGYAFWRKRTRRRQQEQLNLRYGMEEDTP